jgi:hypothetical protein
MHARRTSTEAQCLGTDAAARSHAPASCSLLAPAYIPPLSRCAEHCASACEGGGQPEGGIQVIRGA